MKPDFFLHKDHLGREVSIPYEPQRIISLCPSQTETLIELGLQDKMVGRTRFCIHPEEIVKEITVIGGTKKADVEKIRELNPDLIIGEKEENTPEMIEGLEKDFPVYITDVTDLPSAYQMIRDLGYIGGKKEAGIELADRVKEAFDSIKPFKEAIPVIYFIWKEPWMVVGQHTYIGSVLDKLGLQNIYASTENRYPSIHLDEFRNSGAKLVLLSSEPFPFKEKHIEALKELLPEAHIELVDGEMFSWYGSRMLNAKPYLQQKVEEWQQIIT